MTSKFDLDPLVLIAEHFNHDEEHPMEAVNMEEWLGLADNWLTAQPEGRTFTADNLVEEIGTPSDGKHNAVGGWFRRASSAQRIVWKGYYQRSERGSRRGNFQRVWRKV